MSRRRQDHPLFALMKIFREGCDLPPHARLVAASIAARMRWDDRRQGWIAYPGKARIAADAGVSVRTVDRALPLLCGGSFPLFHLLVRRGRKTHCYVTAVGRHSVASNDGRRHDTESHQGVRCDSLTPQKDDTTHSRDDATHSRVRCDRESHQGILLKETREENSAGARTREAETPSAPDDPEAEPAGGDDDWDAFAELSQVALNLGMRRARRDGGRS